MFHHANTEDVMYANLLRYKEDNDGSIEMPEIPDGEKDIPEMKTMESLRCWCKRQVAARLREVYISADTDIATMS